MALPRVTDGGNNLKKDSSCQHAGQALADSRRGVTHLVLIEGLTTSRRKNQNVVKYYTET